MLSMVVKDATRRACARSILGRGQALRSVRAPATRLGRRLLPGRARASSSTTFRGSTLMFGGRLTALVVAFLTQIVVRHLSAANYGAFAYALSAILLLEVLSTQPNGARHHRRTWSLTTRPNPWSR